MKHRFFHWILAAALLTGLSSCAKKQGQEAQEEAKPAAAMKTVDAATAGSVSGIIKLEGAPPKFRPINMSAEPYCSSQHKAPVYPDEVVIGAKGALENVIVYVKGGDLDQYGFDMPKEPVVLDQKGCLYTPHVLALMAGQDLEVVNTDNTTHNIHPMPKDNREWNKSQPPGAPPIEDVFARPELAIPVKCNVHPWMKAYIGVFKTPYFAVTGKTGGFDIRNLPPGTYTVEAWHEKYGTLEQQVTLGPKESKTLSFTFKAPSGD